MKLKLSILFFALSAGILASSASSQVKFKIPIVYLDSVYTGNPLDPTDTTGLVFDHVYNDTIWFGYHSLGTVCRDTLTGYTTHWSLEDTLPTMEDKLPPAPPSGIDNKFVAYDPVIQACFQDGSKEDIRQYRGPGTRDSLRFKTGADNNSIFFHREILRWPSVLLQYFDSCRLKNVGGPVINVEMTLGSKAVSLLFNASQTPAHNFRIIPSGPKIPPPTTPTVVLLSPADGALDQPFAPTLTWSPAAGALFYRIQVAKADPNFGSASLIADDSLGASTTSKALAGLSSGVVYYWRVAVFTAGGVSYFQNPAFHFTTLILTTPTICDLPANGQIGVAVNPTLSWHAQLAAGVVLYHVQLANDSNFTSLVVNDSTLVNPSRLVNVQNCLKYYWRARTKNGAGWGPFSNVSPPSPPRPAFTFKVVLATPSVPVLLGPADGAPAVSVPPTLTWQNDVCTDSTQIQVALDSLGIAPLTYNKIVAGASVQIPGLAQNVTYFWHATAMNALPSSSASSEWRRFTTILQPPAVPVLGLPADLDLAVSVSPTFSWNAVPYADTYTLKVYRDAGFTQKIFDDSSLVGTSQSVAGLANCTPYYWKVKAMNAAGSSAYSTSRSFKTVNAAPGAALLLSPSNGQSAVSFTPRLVWTRPDVCADYFIVTISRDTLFGTTVSRDSTIDTNIVVGPLVALTKYFWKVGAYNKTQGTSAFNEFSFVVTDQTPPGTPVLSYPSNGQDGLPSNFTLRWDSADKAATYRVQVAYDSLFTLLLVNDSTVAQSSTPGKAIGPLLNSRTYWWRVNAKNVKGTSAYSPIWSFGTLSPPSAPTLITPSNGAGGVSISPTFYWTLADRADSYRLQVARESSFVDIVRDDSNIVNMSWTIAGQLAGLKTYYWRVTGRNSVGYGAPSAKFTFTTERVGAADWAIPLAICETGPACDTLFFGINPSATYGIDYALGEYELPQPPPSGWFDVRFVDSRPVSLIGEGLRMNAHPFRSYTQIDTFKVRFQPGLGSYPMILSWSDSLIRIICDSMVVKDEYTGAIVHQRMDLVPTVSTNLSSLLIIEYGAFPFPTGVRPPPRAEVPKGFTLSQNYPNPFNPTTRFDFSTDESAFITITVYDVLGREIASLAHEPFAPGVHHTVWNGSDAEGRPMPSGIYYVRMLARTSTQDGTPFSMTRKIIMMK